MQVKFKLLLQNFTFQQNFTSRLQRLHLLPLSLYHEMHVVLLFARIINSKTDIDWEKYVQIIDTCITRSHAIPFHTSKCFQLKKCESDFWQRACSLSNIFNKHLNQDVIISTQCKCDIRPECAKMQSLQNSKF